MSTLLVMMMMIMTLGRVMTDGLCRASVVGKRLVYLFRTKREIFEGEELTFFYGEDYFEAAGMLCRCDGREGMHKAERSFE